MRFSILRIVRHYTSGSMASVMMPKATAKFIAEKSEDIKINKDGVNNLAKVMFKCVKDDTYNIKSWKTAHELNPSEMTKETVDWIFVADTLNFSFWSEDENKKYMVRYKGKEYTGYWSWIAALNRALDNGIKLTDPKFYANITKEKLSEILKSDSNYEIPLLEERAQVLQEAGKKLVEKYDGSFVNCIEKCEKSAESLLKLVVEEFPSYRDVADYNGEKVGIYKRVQILIADIWACFEGKSYGEFNDINFITMFADYRIPQALVQFKAMTYSDKLTEFLNKDQMMKTGDKYEVEIRGCSIQAVEEVTEETRKLLSADDSTKDAMINAIIIDHYLWDYRREHATDIKVPFHKIRCIYY
ncbi:queuosine 5'-phosphate N-glycosylase/hydrolase-like [Mytilus edulis]|uniref:queuosine 5'-phosphate N-glycosylase/hydrolase-like n=1 Tax=Mytilus edulis TaxID=6550 RepID=UPI0039EF0ABA